MTDQTRHRRDDARSDLRALPGLYAELAHCLTEHGTTSDGGGRRKVTGSPAPLRLDVLHLVDTRHKPRWDGEDPRQCSPAARYGVLPALETWTRVIAEERAESGLETNLAPSATIASECAAILEHWAWATEQPWMDELVGDVRTITGQVRDALGVRREYQPSCRYCANAVHAVDETGVRVNGWDQAAYGSCAGCEATYPKGPALDALAQVQPPMPLRDIAEIIGVPLKTLQRWDAQQVIQPAAEWRGKRRGRMFDLAEVRVSAARIYQRKVS